MADILWSEYSVIVISDLENGKKEVEHLQEERGKIWFEWSPDD